jgi:hypothetical protein
MTSRSLLLAAAALSLLVSASPLGAASKATFFVFAKIQDKVGPVERGAKYEDPLDAALKQARLGEVTGGGTSLNKDNSIAWVGVDIELINLSEALEFTRRKLRELGAPKGSVLEFKRGGKEVVEPIHDVESPPNRAPNRNALPRDARGLPAPGGAPL